jgi:hypothetical protein
MDEERRGTGEEERSESVEADEGAAAALAAYKAFIDGCAERARASVVASRMRDNVPFEQSAGEHSQRFNRLPAGLSAAQRAAIADLLLGERQAAIGDLLAFMTWKGLQVVHDGVALAWEPFGTENYYDFICRLEGDPWPDERSDHPQNTPT